MKSFLVKGLHAGRARRAPLLWRLAGRNSRPGPDPPVNGGTLDRAVFYQEKQPVDGAGSGALALETHGRLTDIRAVPEPWGLTGHVNTMEWLDGRVE